MLSSILWVSMLSLFWRLFCAQIEFEAHAAIESKDYLPFREDDSSSAEGHIAWYEGEQQPFVNYRPLASEPGPDNFTKGWIGAISPAIGDTPISLLSFPGTHNTISRDLSKHLSSQDNLPPWVNSLIKTFSWAVDIGGFVRDQAVTQYISLTQQLDAGIRFIDFRVMYDSLEGNGKNMAWYGIHSVLTEKHAYEYVKDIKDWLDKNPTEVIFIFVSRHGSATDTGQEQYPKVDIATKRALWHNITTTFRNADSADGTSMMVNTTQFPWNGMDTTMNNLVKAGQRIFLMASDWQEFTDSSEVAMNTAETLQNEGWSDVEHVSTNWRQNIERFFHVEERMEQYRRENKFLLVNMAAEPTEKTITALAYFHFTAGAIEDLRKKCYNAYGLDYNRRCFRELLSMSQFYNYHSQYAIQYAWVQNFSLPNALYVDAVTPDGLILTGTRNHRDNIDNLDCTQEVWGACGSFQCPKDETPRPNEHAHLFVHQPPLGTARGTTYDTSGKENGICWDPFHSKIKCCRDVNYEIALASNKTRRALPTAGFSYVDLFARYNVGVACRGREDTEACKDALALTEPRRFANELLTFSDRISGRSPQFIQGAQEELEVATSTFVLDESWTVEQEKLQVVVQTNEQQFFDKPDDADNIFTRWF
jgi:hypothetical protein